MKKLLCILATLLTLNCQGETDIYNSEFDIRPYMEYIEFEKPKTIWSYLFIDRKLRFKLQLNPACWFWDFSNSTIPVNYWCFKISIDF
jgi:hypothetical protein